MKQLRKKLQHHLEVAACQFDHFLYQFKMLDSDVPVMGTQTMGVSVMPPSKFSQLIEFIVKKLEATESKT
ncbi:MAG: hypothetical protein ACRC24_01620 [Vibrionaceae bacterium]